MRQRAFLIIRKHANKTPNSPRQHSCENVKNTLEEGCLAGSVRKACGSRYQGDEFEPHVLCRDYLSKYIFFFLRNTLEGISSLSLQKEKFAVEKRKDNDDTLQTEREFVTKQ